MAGLLVNGEWKQEDEFADDDGAFNREDSKFRDEVVASDAPSQNAKTFTAESGRYHLYVSYACPWANRALIMRALKQLDNHISVSVVHPYMLDNGWELNADFDGSTGDDLYGFDYMYQVYLKAKPDCSGKVTVPVLWDKQSESIVNNESAEIIRMFNSAFNDITGDEQNFYPEALCQQIDETNQRVYETINNGVYKAGFATKQDVYEKEVSALFDSLDWLETHLSDGRSYLCGEDLTEADIRLFVTLVRFDAVYFGHFKCNLRQISDYTHLQPYLERLYAMPAFGDTVHMDHIKHHYYYSHKNLNPHGIVPSGPILPWLKS